MIEKVSSVLTLILIVSLHRVDASVVDADSFTPDNPRPSLFVAQQSPRNSALQLNQILIPLGLIVSSILPTVQQA